ncbi:hypothetical protein, partial [Reyranella sp.]|uniref:hypothetical protein n=1 Tax=Reyranella sp. TaxID=1929291 RepID=UPI003D0E8087
MADLAGSDGINDGITCTTPTAGVATLVARADRSGTTADSNSFTLTVTSAGTDSTAPTVPLGVTAADNADGTATLTWDASSDPLVSGVGTGVASYRVQVGGSTAATVTAAASNVQPAL